MRKCLITRADMGIQEMTKVTHPILLKFAKDWGCDFIVLDHTPPIMTEDNRPHYRILKTREILENYDRAVLIDSDVLITPHCPDPFEVVDPSKMGSIFEDKGSRAPDRRGKISQIQRSWGNVGWESGYTNAGFFVMSSRHKDIFLPHENRYWVKWGSADLHMSYMGRKLGFEIQELDFKWNHMTMFSEPWNNNPNRFDSYVIHYAGRGIFDKSINRRIDQIVADRDYLYGDAK